MFLDMAWKIFVAIRNLLAVGCIQLPHIRYQTSSSKDLRENER